MSYIGGPLPGQEKTEEEERESLDQATDLVVSGIKSLLPDLRDPKEATQYFTELGHDIWRTKNPIRGTALFAGKRLMADLPVVRKAVTASRNFIDPAIQKTKAFLDKDHFEAIYATVGVEPRLLSEASQVVDGVPVTNVFKVQLDDYVPGTGPLDAPVRSSTRTRLQRRGKSNELLREAGNTPEGIARHKEALAYRLKHGSLKGYKDTTTPWILPDGEEIIFRKTDTGIKKSLKSDRASAQLQRSTNELIQTHGKQDWNELFEGFIDPKQFPIHKYEGHHARMVEGYTWAFDGADTKTTKKITEHFYNKKIALGKTQFNRNNLPHPVHKALHSWMDKQLGLNGLDMPSLKGLNAEQRIAHLEVYMEHIQPVIDEATFSLMKRYQKFGDTVDWTKPKAYKQLFLKDASMADQFIDVNL